MSTEAKTLTPLDEKLTQKELSDLRAIRRAGEAIHSCSEILSAHLTNEPSVPVNPGVFIRLNVQQKCNLQYAIEACASRIMDIFDKSFDGVGFEDGICEDVTKEAQLQVKMQAGEISFDEFSKAVSDGRAA